MADIKQAAKRIKRCRVWIDDGDDYQLETAFKLGKAWFLTAKWTQSCSGCCELGDYGSNPNRHPYDEKNQCHIGFGCDECGYTGKRRVEMWVPIYDKHAQIVLNIRNRVHVLREVVKQ